MYPEHPWAHDEFGKLDHLIFQNMGFANMIVEFDVSFDAFFKFARTNRQIDHLLLMKVMHYLAKKYIMKRTLGLNHKDYPAGYHVGYVRPKTKDSDCLSSVVLEENESGLKERDIRKEMPAWKKFIATKFPRFAIFYAKYIAPKSSALEYSSVQVTRYFLKNFSGKITSCQFTTSRCVFIAIPYGKTVPVTVHMPHAFGNANYYEPFIEELKRLFENPEQIPKEVLNQGYERDK
jgi:hypothetical protein